MAQPLIGTVVSTKMQKTIVVSIERKFRHPVYRKVITRHKKLKVHSEDKNVHEGDTVMIKETRPISKDKHYIFMQKVEKKVK
jgi:small subunit ribosomal protein S17